MTKDIAQLWIPYRMPGLNDYVDACRSNKYAGAVMAKKWKMMVSSIVGAKKQYDRVYVDFLWVEQNKKRDPDNIVFAKKFILDGLVDAGLIKKDGWAQISGFSDRWMVDKDNPGVRVTVRGEA